MDDEHKRPRDDAVRAAPGQRPVRRDPGTGHDAASPLAIPPIGWRAIGGRVWAGITGNTLWIHCGCVGFFGFLSIFPVLGLFVLVYGLSSDTDDIEGQLDLVAPLIPPDVLVLLEGRLLTLANNTSQNLTLGLILTVGIAIWTGSRGVNAVIDLLNLSYHEPQPRSFVRRFLLAVGMTLGALIGLPVVLASVAALPLLVENLPIAAETERAALWGRWPVLAAFVFGGLMLLFRYAPHRRPARWRWLVPGAALSTVLWMALSVAFSAYVEWSNFYGATFGTASVAAVLMLWIYYSSLAVAIGAIVNAEIELQTRHDSTRGPYRPRGSRGAVVADRLPRPSDE